MLPSVSSSRLFTEDKMTENKDSDRKSASNGQSEEKEFVKTYGKTENDDYGFYFYPNRNPGKVADEKPGFFSSMKTGGLWGMWSYDPKNNMNCKMLVRNCVEKNHKDAMEASKQWKSVKIVVVNAASKSEEVVTEAMRNVYFAAKKHLPSSIVPDLNKLCIRQGVTKLNHLQVDAYTTYEHNTSSDDFQECIMTTINDDIIKSVDQSKKYSIMIDESTDISVKQNLVTHACTISRQLWKCETRNFLVLKELYRADAQSIYCKVVELLNDKNIKLNGLLYEVLVQMGLLLW